MFNGAVLMQRLSRAMANCTSGWQLSISVMHGLRHGLEARLMTRGKVKERILHELVEQMICARA